MLTSSSSDEESGKRATERDELPELPPEIWREIGRRNRSRLDVTRFRSVCRAWRSSLPRPIRFPLQVNEPNPETLFFITEITFYAATVADDPSATWILAFDEDYQGGKFSVSALLHYSEYMSCDLDLPRASQICNLSFLANAYRLHTATPFPLPQNNDMYCFSTNLSVLKTVIISSDCSRSNPNYSRLSDLKVVSLLSTRKLAVLSLTENHWNTDFPGNSSFQDIINHKGQLHAVNELGETFAMRSSKAKGMTKLTLNLISDVEDGDDSLHMFIYRESVIQSYVQVYRLTCEWVQVPARRFDHRVFVKDATCCFAAARSLVRPHTADLVLDCQESNFMFLEITVGFNNTHLSRLSHIPRAITL